MTQRVTRDIYEQRYRQRVEYEQAYGTFEARRRADNIDKIHQETEARAVLRQKAAQQRIADQEYEMAEKIYRMQHEREERARTAAEQDAIAQALHEQTQAELRDQKMRGVLRENDPEYRELKSKLQLALVSQTRDNQRRDLAMRRQMEEQERLETEQEMMRHQARREQQRQAEEEAKRQQALATRRFIQDQLADRERRRQLLEVAQAERDKKEVDEIIRKVKEEDEKARQDFLNKQARERQNMADFMAARERLKAEEKRMEEEENQKMKSFSAAVDERLERAKEEQRRRDAQRQGIAERIAGEINAKRAEDLAYENMCIELAQQQELQRLKEREEAEARKIQQQIEDMQRFMIETARAKQQQAERDRQEEERLRRQIIEQQKKIAELAEIEQEKNRIRIEKFRRELTRQMVQKKEMFEQARQQELRKLEIEQMREEERQRILNEERRKLVINHILSMGPEAIKYLPKGVLKEEDLDYLPEDYRNAVLSQRMNGTTTATTTTRY